MNWVSRLGRRPFFIRLFHWEYWSFEFIYAPIYVVWLWFTLKARSFFFFAASNPGIQNGGFLSESKKDIHPLIPPEYLPRSVFFSIPSNPEIVLAEVRRKGLQFPLIGKPDIGGKGRGIQALSDESELINYVLLCYTNFHIQEFVSYKNEVGIFYYRYPSEQKGHISGIVTKEFLKVVGDGHSSIRELLVKDKRAILQMEKLEKGIGSMLDIVLPAGDERVVVPYGNHARGAKFIDDTRLVDGELEATIDKICQRIPGFYFGRLDIRFQDWAGLKQGQNMSIIEVNGAGSEPTHIYDPRHTIFFGWKEIIRHINILCKISMQNHRKGYPYLTVREGLQMFREDKLNSRKLAAMEDG